MNEKVIRLIVFSFFIGGLVFYYSYPCLSIKFIEIPIHKINSEYIFILFGNLCVDCPSGQYLLNQSKIISNAMFFLPHSYTQNDIENFKRNYHLKDKVIKRINGIDAFLKKLAKCENIDNWKRNYKIRIKRKKVNSFVIF